MRPAQRKVPAAIEGRSINTGISLFDRHLQRKDVLNAVSRIVSAKPNASPWSTPHRLRWIVQVDAIKQ